ncbi:hypothetical protein GQ53DRAFT_720276 [Thozetella sp. PMI_491]|nr:hypothetical protein GQ53DRAFT_720276 [Thozetella sp. PMI_491]
MATLAEPPTDLPSKEKCHGDDLDPLSERDTLPAGDNSESPQSGVIPDAPADDEDEQMAAADPPVRRPRRTARACDECRRKKVKCNGKRPCGHCQTYGYQCAYDLFAPRRRRTGPEYVQGLEERLARVETFLTRLLPDVDLSDENLEALMNGDVAMPEISEDTNFLARAARASGEPNPDDESELLSTVKDIGELNLNEGGGWEFHGTSSGALFLRRMKDYFQLGYDYRVPFLPEPSWTTLRPPRLLGGSRYGAPIDVYRLPPRALADRLCDYSFNWATCLLRVVHVPTFNDTLNILYRKPPEAYTNEECRFLALFYAVLALGCMYDFDENDPSNPNSYQAAMDRGFKYYNAARFLLHDITECRDMISLQALLFCVLFLQAISDFRGCHTLVGVALRSALGMGLHRHLPHTKMSPIEDQTRRRVFHVLRQMDIHTSTILGFPLLLSEEDFDQELPTEVDDEQITKHRILPVPPGSAPSIFQAFNARAKLMGVLAKILKHVYPLKGIQENSTSREATTYMISYARIQEIERDLRNWLEELPPIWRPSPEGPIELVRARILLRFTYAYVQLMLYRPFLHCISPRLSAGKPADGRAYACAVAGISVSRNIVRIGLEIQKRAVLIGPYWFIIYTQFFATLSLVFYVMEHLDKPDSLEALSDAKFGRDAIAAFSHLSVTASKVIDILDPLFESLPKSRNPNQRRRKPEVPPWSSNQTSNAMRQDSNTLGITLQPQNYGSKIDQHMGVVTSQGGIHMPSETGGTGFSSNLSGVSLNGRAPPIHQNYPNSSLFPGAGNINNQSIDLNTIMFPSGDPLAYPQQPTLNWPEEMFSGLENAGAPFNLGSTQRYPENMFDDIEGQLWGPNPVYFQYPQQEDGPMH